MSKVDIEAAPTRFGSAYPPPLDEPCKGLRRWKLGTAAGLTQFGANLTRLPPRQWTSQRHWHTAEDEFVWVIEGEVELVTSRGEEVLRAGDCAGFAAGVADGHHFQNRSDREAVLLEIGSRRPGEDRCCYPDNGVIVEPGLRVRPYGSGPDDSVPLCPPAPPGSPPMKIPPSFIVHQTEHWILNHHLTSALPGYLMLGSRAGAASLADLLDAALAELGFLQAKTQRILETQLRPRWLYISRYGHSPGLPIHFHFIPVYDWVEELFWRDERYRVLQTFSNPSKAQTPTDGAELSLFIWREFGEADQPPAVRGPSIEVVIQRLQEAFQADGT